ncbi:MAG: UbiD family decarboxylase [Chloroflexi bacterium]|nr:UbiD family decarboxylase [Chloroflexota bacterium]
MGSGGLRDFIAALDRTGDLVRIKEEVDWDIEAGAISRRNFERSGPCLWFQKIKDYPEDFTLLNGPVATWRRVAVALGLAADTPVREIYRVYEERLANRVKPNIVARARAACKENILTGDEIDLYRLPAPMIHEGDGGRYIGTWDIIITRDQQSNWTNWGMYRFMIHNKNWLAGWPQPTSQLSLMMHRDYLPKNQAMPAAVVIGADPLYHMVATAPVRPGENEVEVAGALKGQPVDLVKCETNELMVPADAEIVVEGEIPADVTVPDGPFGEYPGYRSGTMAEGVGFRVTAITFRDNPILTMTALGIPPDDSSIAASLTAGVGMKVGLQRRGIPVIDVYVPPEGVTHLIVVGVAEGGHKVAQDIIDYFTARRVMVSKVIVVDNDVDVFNMGQVLHAFATKCHPGNGILVNHYEGRANALTPCFSAEERRVLNGASVAFDATWPAEWPREVIPTRASFEDIYSAPSKQKVVSRWREYGLE